MCSASFHFPRLCFPEHHAARKLLFGSLLTALLVTPRVDAAIPAFPGAEGYGAYAVGGRNGDVYHVTNLNASGAGSFADAISTVPTAGRTIVFDVSGYIRFPSSSNGTRLTSSKVTIAGQTAPGDGIGFYNNFFRISGDDIVLRHLRFRMGYYGSGGDCIDLDSGCNNAVLDHVSMEFSTDENMSSFSSAPENLTLQYSLNAWGLETHSCGGLWDQNHATSHHNLWAYNHTRNPKSRPSGLLEWVNNVTYDWDIGFIMGDTETNATYRANVIGSYFLSPPGNTQSKAFVKATVAANGKPNFSLYLSGCLNDNDGDGLLNGTDKGYSIVEGTAYDPAGSATGTSGAYGYYKYTAPFANTGSLAVTTDDALTAYKKVVSSAGALRLDANYAGTLRDEVDTILLNRLVAQTHTSYSGETGIHRETDTGASGSGFGVLNSTAAPVDTDRDGMPDYYENALGWSASTDDHTTALANGGGIVTGTTFFPANTPAGYTRLEEYLQFLAIPHGIVAKNVSGTPTSLAVDLRKYTSGFSSSPVFTVTNLVGGSITQSGTGNYLVTFVPTPNYTGRARFDFTVSDAQGGTWTQTCGIVVSASGLPRDLVWLGDNTANPWDNSTGDWLLNGAATAFGSGDYATFNGSGSNSPSVNVASAVTASSMVVDTTNNYTFGGTGSITTNGPLTKRGASTLTFLNAANNFASGTIEAGTVVLGVGGNVSGGKFILLDGTVFTNLYANTQPSVTMPFEVPAGNSATINTGNRIILSGALTGGGTLNYNVQTTVSRVDLKGATAAFAGNVNFVGSGGVRLFYNGGSFNGFDNATLSLGGSVNLQPQTNSGSGNTFNIAALVGTSANASLTGGTAGAVAYVVGSNNASTAYAGTITGNASLAKTGTGTLTLGGVNTYTGATNVSSGTLLVDGSLGGTAVTVASGAYLGGAGAIAGAVNAASGATLTPGTLPYTGATLTLNGGLALGGNTLYYDLTSNPTGANDKIAMGGGALALSGTQTFQFLFLDGILGAGSYDLISGAATTSGTPTFASNLPTGTRQTFTLGLVGTTVRLTVTGNTAALAWTGSNNGGTWDAQTTANWSGGPTATFFNNDAATFNDTAATGTVNISGNVAPRILNINNSTLAYTLGGSGSITGAGQLIKSGTGLLTISNGNSYSGGTTINPGSTVALANDTANTSGLGTGSITLNGGVLSMYSNANTYNSATYNLVVPVGQTGQLNADARCDLYGTLTGGGTFNFNVPFVRTTLFTDWSAFTGTVNVIGGGNFRMGTNYSFPGFPNATLNLGDSVAAYYTGTLSGGAGTTIEIGELSGSASSGLQGGATGGRSFTYRIGRKTTAGSEVIYPGTISEQGTGTTTSFVKAGAGIWTLSGTCNWNGGTTVEQGTLKISGTVNCLAALNVNPGASLRLVNGTVGADAINITAGATLSGSGTINGDLINDGTIASGTGSSLTVNGDFINNGTTRLTNGAALGVSGTFTNNGLLDVLTSAATLPANFINNGVVIDSSAAKLTSFQKTGSTFTVTIASYTGHNYQLQRTSTLGAATAWENVAPVQAGSTQNNGNPTVITLSDSSATGSSYFYRILILP